MKVNTGTGGMFCATPSSAAAGTEAKLAITFPASYSLDSANWVFDTNNLPVTGGVDTPPGITTITGWPNTASATFSVTGTTVTINFDPSTTGAGDLTSTATLYCFNFTDSATAEGTTGTAAPVLTDTTSALNETGVAKTQTSASATIDSTEFATTALGDDQIVVTATVPPSFAFTLDNGSGGTTDSFGTMSVGAAGNVNSTTGVTGTVTTNAKSGWIAWAKDTNRNPSAQGLRSASAAYTIPTPGTVDGTPSTLSGGPGGTDAYALDVDLTLDASGGCSVAIAGEYNGTGTNQGGTFSNVFQPIAACTGGSPGTANGDQIKLIERAAINGATPAATDYTDTITVVAAGNF